MFNGVIMYQCSTYSVMLVCSLAGTYQTDWRPGECQGPTATPWEVSSIFNLFNRHTPPSSPDLVPFCIGQKCAPMEKGNNEHLLWSVSMCYKYANLCGSVSESQCSGSWKTFRIPNSEIRPIGCFTLWYQNRRFPPPYVVFSIMVKYPSVDGQYIGYKSFWESEEI